MASKLAEHHAAVTVNAPVHQVYSLFSHFNDFPKFMSFVKEVTYYDDQRSHWVAEVAGRHEWDAVNENWVTDQQIGWRSTNGLENYGKVTFQPLGNNQTRVDVYVNYNPPAGVLGDIGENVGVGGRFENALQHDLDHFARMVDQAPPGALDPTSSNYLFHSASASAKGTATERQKATMQGDDASRYNAATGNTPMNTGAGYDNTAGTAYNAPMPGSYTSAPGTGYDTTPAPGYGTASGMSTGDPGVRDEYTNTSDKAGYGYTPGSGSINPGYTGQQGLTGSNAPLNTPPTASGAYDTGTAGTDRPVLDRDIINEPENRVPASGEPLSSRDPVMPPATSTSERVLPPDQGRNRDNVLPPERTD